MRITSGGQPHHLQSMLGFDHFFCHLMGRDRGRNEDHLLELICLANFFRTSEVTQMDGVEGASKQPNPPTCRLFFDLSTLPFLINSMAHSARREKISTLCSMRSALCVFIFGLVLLRIR